MHDLGKWRLGTEKNHSDIGCGFWNIAKDDHEHYEYHPHSKNDLIIWKHIRPPKT